MFFLRKNFAIFPRFFEGVSFMGIIYGEEDFFDIFLDLITYVGMVSFEGD